MASFLSNDDDDDDGDDFLQIQSYANTSVTILLSLSKALQPFGPWPLLQFLTPIHSREDSSDG
jgi:hypothetical protein